MSIFDELIDLLERVGCQFWTCKGPDEPYVNIATCAVCQEIKALRKAKSQINPRRPYDDEIDGTRKARGENYLTESDRDFLENNNDLAVQLLETGLPPLEEGER